MFQSWRFRLREAEEALNAGRLEEARRLIAEHNLLGFLPGKRLAARLARVSVTRALQHARAGEFDAGWRDLDAALSLVDETGELAEARQTLTASALSDAEQHVRCGNSSAALAILEKLARHHVTNRLTQTLRDVVRRIDSAKNLERRGRFSDAEAQLAAASVLRPDMAELQQRVDECHKRSEQSAALVDALHRAMGEQRWRDAASLADQLLALAPDFRLAREARRRAWAEVGAELDESQRHDQTRTWSPAATRAPREDDAWPSVPSGPRYLLWVDGVGGYLVCLADEVICGQASPANEVAIPILADISRRHAKIRREGEAYLLEPYHATRVNGQPVQNRTLLSDGDLIELGTGVQLRFRKPHALSGSARLDFVSSHRTQPFCDGVVLMAESCVLGPKRQNHVVCREWSGDVVLFRQEGDLFCRAMEAIEIDGQLCDGRGRLGSHSHVVGNDFSLGLEELDKCLTQPLR